ncbi:1761_t:CDS:2, partial [Acaulospora morrowiae]
NLDDAVWFNLDRQDVGTITIEDREFVKVGLDVASLIGSVAISYSVGSLFLFRRCLRRAAGGGGIIIISLSLQYWILECFIIIISSAVDI